MTHNNLSKKEKKELITILISFSFFSLSRGLWYNYQTLWLKNNDLSITTISTITGLASLLSVSVIFIFSSLIKKSAIKSFVTSLLFIKLLLLILLFISNENGHYIFIKILIMADLVTDTYIITSIYPMIALVKRSNTLYSIKSIITNSFYDLGVFCSGFFLGKIILTFNISYNTFLFISLLLVGISFILMLNVKIEEHNLKKSKQESKNISDNNLIKYLKSDHISQLYLLRVLLCDICFNSVIGLKMLILTEIVLLNPKQASNYLLVIGIVSDVVSILVLKYFTSKKYSVNVFVKFGGRFILYTIAFITNNTYIFMFAIFYTMLFSESYNNVTDAPYVNRVNDELQFSFSNFKGMCSYFGQAIGIWLCGFSFIIGTRYMFGVTAIIILIQILLMLKLNHKLTATNIE